MNNSIEKYKKLLNKEIDYLKNRGGRQYKVTNGKLISAKVSEYAYVFELETELYLADAAPIRIRVGESICSGEVLICEDFSITVVLKQQIGEKVPVAYITVEPWKLLKGINDKLVRYGNGEDFPIAKMLIEEGPYLSERKPLEEIKKGQREAIIQGCKNPITIIWGPPGTGKTYTMSQLARAFQKKGQKVLIVSHSNVSVDGVIKKIVELLEEKGELALLEEGRVLRYGYVRDEELAKNQLATSFNYCINKFPETFRQKEALEKEKLRLRMQGMFHSERGVEIEKKIQKLRLDLRTHEKVAVKKADIVATTISKLTVDQVFEDMKYDVVMFDEASMAYIPQIITAACSAKKHFICVGDFRQLPSIAQSESKQELVEDIFTFLGIASKGGTVNDHLWLVMLNAQRRMHPRIAKFASLNFYSNLLGTAQSAVEKVQKIAACAPFENEPMIQIDLTGTYCAASKNNDNSRFNLLSAFIAFQTALECESHMHKVGIITPYAVQMRLIRAMIEDYRKRENTQIMCSTVHQFQGSEREVIIFDAIESYPFKKAGVLLNDNQDGSVERLINVAVTRAQGKFITIAHNRFWMNKLGNMAHPLYRLLKYASNYGKTLEKKELESYLQAQQSPVITFLKEDEYLEPLLKDIQKAKQSVKVFLPSGQLNKEAQGLIQELIKVYKRGLRVSVKCNNYEELPKEWQVLSQSSEKAIFPVIIIDKRIVWYGAPTARTTFEEGNSKYITIYPIIVRFQGKHTAEMIQNVIEPDEIVTDYEHNLGENENATGLPQKGLVHFIESAYRCNQCGAKLTLKKGRSGKFYLGCTSCKQTELLKMEMINDYMLINQVKCPIHKGPLKARIGQYGVYIQCSCGIERHYFKPNEI